MKKLILLTTLIALSFSSCSTSTSKDIAHERNQVKPFQTRESIVERTTEMLDKSSLTEVQKDRFIDLHMKTYDKVQTLNQKIKKTKMVLFKNLFAQKYDERKMDMITREIKKMSSQKIDIMFSALAKSKEILGKQSQELLDRNLWHSTDL